MAGLGAGTASRPPDVRPLPPNRDPLPNMRSSFASRRPKARKIEADDEEEPPEDDSALRPASSRPKPTKKKRSTLRLSFGPETGTAATAAVDSGPAPDEEIPIVLKKSALSRKAIERSALRKAGLAAGAVGIDQLNATPASERPSYSKEYLEELKSSTSTKPVEEEEEEAEAGNSGDDYDMILDDDVMAVVEAGNQLAVARLEDAAPAGTTGILDEGLVRVLKARRAERSTRSKAGDFISLDGDEDMDDGDGEILLKSKKKKKSRLRGPDDGGFDDEEMEKYVEDGGIILGGKAAQREQERRRREGIRDTINQAEGINSDEDADSDFSRDSLAEEWERDQIRKGAFSANASASAASDLEMLTRQPPNVTPLPSLTDALKRLEDSLAAMEFRKGQTARQAETLLHEKREIAQRENMVQDRLKKAGEEYEKLRGQLGMGGGGPEGVVSRGLESFGNTPIRAAEDS